MKFIPTLALTAIGSIVIWISGHVIWIAENVSHTIVEVYSDWIPQFLFSSCMAILFYRKTDTSRKLVKSMIISIMPFILMVCFAVAYYLYCLAFYLFFVFGDDPFPVRD